MEKLTLVPVGLLSAFIAKLLIFGTNPSEMGVVVSLSAIVASFEYLSKSRRIQTVEQTNTEFKAELLKKVEDQVQVINKQNEVIKKLAEELELTRNSITSLKMASGMTGMKRTG